MAVLPQGNFGFTAIFRNGFKMHGIVRAANREQATTAVKSHLAPAEVQVTLRNNRVITHQQMVGKEQRGHLIDASF